ncbi:MAG: YceI family protein [Bacteroidetes bacterium]|jgi:polyisoprenoid-binding protein YceI|nr:MAG: YceI family protein [Bacteroidota bacterium]
MSTIKWALDPTHSELQFKVKHLMISTVTGQFNQFNATVDTEDNDFSKAKIDFTAEVDSISTNNAQRDAHLKNTDFFDAPNHPQIIFKSEKLEKVLEDEYRLTGTLAMRGTSKPVVLDVEFGGITVDPWGNTRAGFTVTGKINRQDFGVSFSAITDTGSILLGDEVKIIASVQFVKQAVAESVLAV